MRLILTTGTQFAVLYRGSLVTDVAERGWTNFSGKPKLPTRVGVLTKCSSVIGHEVQPSSDRLRVET
jgi:hypothetical protein